MFTLQGQLSPSRRGGSAACAHRIHGFWRPATRSSWIPPVP